MLNNEIWYTCKTQQYLRIIWNYVYNSIKLNAKKGSNKQQEV